MWGDGSEDDEAALDRAAAETEAAAERGGGGAAEDRADSQALPMLARRAEDGARMSELYERFMKTATVEQQRRYEIYRSSSLPRAAMKRLMIDAVGSTSDRCALLLGAMAKMFVGDLVESARELCTAAGETGALMPSHLRRSYMLTQKRGAGPSSGRHQLASFF